jgi:serine/threonine protein kinase
MRFNTEYLEKKIEFADEYKYAKVDHLVELYQNIKLQNKNNFNIIECQEVKYTKKTLYLKLAPICEPCNITELNVLRKCLSDIAVAIKWLHKKKFLHRDIRWPNIVKSKNNFLLTDFEHSTKTSDSNICELSAFMPEGLEKGSQFLERHDWYMFGKLIDKALPKTFELNNPFSATFSTVRFHFTFSDNNKNEFLHLFCIKNDLLNLSNNTIAEEILDRLGYF